MVESIQTENYQIYFSIVFKKDNSFGSNRIKNLCPVTTQGDRKHPLQTLKNHGTRSNMKIPCTHL